jgi:hypothetical protein
MNKLLLAILTACVLIGVTSYTRTAQARYFVVFYRLNSGVDGFATIIKHKGGYLNAAETLKDIAKGDSAGDSEMTDSDLTLTNIIELTKADFEAFDKK